MAHNGGRSQLNLTTPQTSGEFPTLNALKCAQEWALADNSAQASPDTLSSDGYPISISNGGVYTVGFTPTQAERPGHYVVRWTGEGTISIAGYDAVLVSGSFSGVNGRAILQPNTDRFVLGISAINVANPITNLEYCHIDDEPLLDAGQVFGVRFLQKLREGNFGCIRFLGWSRGNESLMATWAHRKPTTYAFWHGGEMRGSIFGGTTANVGDAYTLAYTGFTLADKAAFIMRFNADGTSVSACTLNVNGTGVKPLKNRAGDNFASTEKPKNGEYVYVIYDADLGTYLKAGGDTALGSQFLMNCMPPEIMVRLCNEIGAHPWFSVPYMALDPKTDFVTQLATYCKNNLASGLIPRFEPSNEVWNFGGAFPATRYSWNKAFAHWGTSNDNHNWYGKVLSTAGQDVSTVYTADRSRYQVVGGVQTATGASASDSNDRLNSSKYVSVDGGSAAKNWATHVAVTDYWNSNRYGLAQESTDATNWAAAGTQAAKDAIIAAYLADNNLAAFATLYGQWRTWASGFGLAMNAYEGGYSPDYTGDATLDAFRSASKAPSSMNGYTTTNYANFVGVGGVFPSHLTFGGVNAWSLFDPDIYATPSPQWDAIVAFNAVSSGLGGEVSRPTRHNYDWLERVYQSAEEQAINILKRAKRRIEAENYDDA